MYRGVYILYTEVHNIYVQGVHSIQRYIIYMYRGYYIAIYYVVSQGTLGTKRLRLKHNKDQVCIHVRLLVKL